MLQNEMNIRVQGSGVKAFRVREKERIFIEGLRGYGESI